MSPEWKPLETTPLVLTEILQWHNTVTKPPAPEDLMGVLFPLHLSLARTCCGKVRTWPELDFDSLDMKGRVKEQFNLRCKRAVLLGCKDWLAEHHNDIPPGLRKKDRDHTQADIEAAMSRLDEMLQPYEEWSQRLGIRTQSVRRCGRSSKVR